MFLPKNSPLLKVCGGGVIFKENLRPWSNFAFTLSCSRWRKTGGTCSGGGSPTGEGGRGGASSMHVQIRVYRLELSFPTSSTPFLHGLAGTPIPWYLSILLCVHGLINIPPQRSMCLQKAERKQDSACFLLQTANMTFMLAPSSVRNVFKIYINLIPLVLKYTYTLPDSACIQVHLYST